MIFKKLPGINWCLVLLEDQEIHKIFDENEQIDYRLINGSLRPQYIRLKPEIYAWCQDNFGLEYFENSKEERLQSYSTTNSVISIKDIALQRHRWCIIHNGMAFRFKKDAMLFRLVWG